MALCQNTLKKLEKFKGLDFMTPMNLAHVVKEEAPKSNENPMMKETIMAIEAWNHSKFCCRNHILNSLEDNLYDVYSLCNTVKELWESLEKKYKINDACSKKFVIGNKYLKYTIVDSKSVVTQKPDRSGGFVAIEANANYVEEGNSKSKRKKNKAPKTKQFRQSALAPKESADAEFFEDIFPYKEKESGSNTKRVHDHSHDEASSSGVQENDVEPRRRKRIKVSKNFRPDFITFLSENEPRTFKEAMYSSEAPLWKEAIKSEMESIMENNTWELVDLPPGSKPIDHKWIFKKKLKADGTIDKFKARLVAKGYRQKEGLDYFDTYSPVSRITSIRTLIVIAAVYNFDINQMDVKTTFLNGELNEEIYMEQPKGFVLKGQKSKVCKLVKSSYGLKQAPKQWHEKFDHTLLTHRFKINESNKCVYIKSNDKTCIIVCLYMDDMLIMGSDKDVINRTKKMLNSSFDMKDLGQADVILRIQIKRNKKILRRFGQFDCKPAVTPFDAGCKLEKNKGNAISQLEYSQVIGSLMYLMNSTRPDLAYANALVRVFHYTKYPPVVEGFSDANWISNTTESKSTSGYVFTLVGAAISWKSSKQKCIALSAMELEFTALNLVGDEVEWLKDFLEDIPMWPKPVTAICIHCDGMVAQSRAKSHVYNGKWRHIRRCHNTFKKLLSSGIVSIDYAKSKTNMANPLTKGLPREQILFTLRGIYLKPIQ
ncbi:hypothetical protein D8674_000188 [Pyrus ussuriensis x Pyrus communis]|uniref:Reverse transcriptase Ty1/copia-type domain-containing protein n=1 Tax=Pyrus ussuriensis x Pyrus communis TaxID=2448454 RepID=A0A5N5F2E3_9ROSA|nr:hypothetical protein D8674_000188 [Pyrus ussuriensis x Pyrus communis]